MAKKKSEPETEKLEREYVIPLRSRFQHVARYKKTPKAIKTIKEFLVRHMKIRDRDLNKIKIDGHLNEAVWQRGIKNPPHKIKVKAVKEGDVVRVELVDYPDKLKFKKARLEKREEKAKSVDKKKKVEKKEEKPAPAEKTEEEKKEVKEKAKAGAEAMQQMEKTQAKQKKHQAGGKTKQPKREKRMALAK